MAKIYRGIFNAIKGKIGNLIGYTWKGISVIRIRPVKYHDAKTPPQRKQRAAFAACSRLACSILKKIIWPIWNPMAEKMSGYNLFISENTKNFDKSGKIADHSAMIFSLGDLSFPKDISAEIIPDSDNSIRIDWSDEPGKPVDSPDDQLLMVTIIDSKVSLVDDNTFSRCKRQAIVKLNWGKDKTIHCYPFFANPSHTLFSPNRYLSLNL
jgi:hypothetical protein